MASNRLKVVDQTAAGRVSARPGAALKALRMQRGWTLAEVSKRTELPVSTLSKIDLVQAKLSSLTVASPADIAFFASIETHFKVNIPGRPTPAQASVGSQHEGHAQHEQGQRGPHQSEPGQPRRLDGGTVDRVAGARPRWVGGLVGLDRALAAARTQRARP